MTPPQAMDLLTAVLLAHGGRFVLSANVHAAAMTLQNRTLAVYPDSGGILLAIVPMPYGPELSPLLTEVPSVQCGAQP